MTKLINEIKLGSEIDGDTPFAIMEAIKIGFKNEDTVTEFNKTAQVLFAELIELYKQKEDPDIKGQKLAAKWWNLVIFFIKGDPKLIQNMLDIGANEDNLPSDVKDLKEATTSFLGMALNTYLKIII